MKILHKNFYDEVSTDLVYNRKFECEKYNCEDDICRCSKIVNERLNKLNIVEITNSIYNLYFDKSEETKRDLKLNKLLNNIDKEIDLYTIDRILRINKAYNVENWRILKEEGYYGQEIESVKIENKLALKLDSLVKESLNIDNIKQRVEYLINLEYGYILDSLVDKNYKVKEIDKSKLIFSNESHYKNVSSKKLDYYSDSNYKNIRGIALEYGDKFKLIDGYHRSFSSNKEKIKLLVAY